MANIIKINGKDIKDSKATQDIADLKSQTDAMSTAMATDVGKALSPKTVTDGKVTEWKFVSAGGGSGAVTDVQIDGTSILDAQGVANVPLATQAPDKIQSSIGLLYARNGYDGVRIVPGYPGRLALNPTTFAQIKAGNEAYLPVTTLRQHESTFYGLAKAAGDTTQSASSNAVGNYTDDAKDKIQQMLGIIDMIAPHEGAQSANAYSVGGAFCHSGKLYKATASIAIGDAIVPGTNCTQTTLVELIGGM